MPEASALTPIDYYDPSLGGNGPLARLDERQVTAIAMLGAAINGSSGGRFLDVGCGDGLFLAEVDQRLGLRDRSWALSGVDYSAELIRLASARPYEFQQCNLEQGLPYEDASLDVVTAGELIEHLYNPDGFLAEVGRALRPGGHLLLSTPNLQAWYNRALFLLGIQPLFYESSTKSPLIGAGPLRFIRRGTVPVGHVRIFNRRAILDLLKSEGYDPVSIRGASFPALPAPMRALDRAFNSLPSLASNMVILARRV
jgi:SAM-dependent methyltransferase